MPNMFVFGSNETGIHGAGAAKQALRYGAEMGQGFGPAGNSFAIPTKDWRNQTLPHSTVEFYVQRFIVYARWNQEKKFMVTRIGCGLAGFADKDIAPLFKYASENCMFDEAWTEWLPNKPYWGTYP